MQPPAVPFLDLRPSHDPLKAELLEAIGGLIDTNAYSNGPDVRALRGGVRRLLRQPDRASASRAGSTRSGSRCSPAGSEPGDEVIVPGAHVRRHGRGRRRRPARRPCSPTSPRDDLSLDPAAAAAAITARTRFLLPVHLYGQLADMARLTELASATGLQIVEDACQAHGAERDGFRAGTAGDRRLLQLLPGQEPRRDGRRRRAHHRRPGARRARARAARARADGASTRHDDVGLHGAARHDPGARAAAQAAAPRRLERRAAPRPPPTTSSTWRASATSRLPPVADGSEPVWHLFVVRTADPAGLGAIPGRARHRRPGATTPIRCICSPAYAHLGYARGRVPGGRAARAPSALAADLPRHPRGAARARRRRGPRSTSTVARLARQRGAVPADRRRRRPRRGRRRARVHEPLRLHDRRRHADRARSSRSSAAP